jgi:hypothetical protein
MHQHHVDEFKKVQNEDPQEYCRYDYLSVAHGLNHGENPVLSLDYILRNVRQ